ncbi:hypothetical protein SBRY_90061 [Actinacidiphila bryophytorum]|uniref:Uncharacterized protein n=1 Tax=Actinacidiphila bryophytorum TaxID=1436133 RepID=A0A9W4H7H8_9ACTN|nr:hypothetical protein SBRY_90061 [Actinacidiphila bryophytorum]
MRHLARAARTQRDAVGRPARRTCGPQLRPQAAAERAGRGGPVRGRGGVLRRAGLDRPPQPGRRRSRAGARRGLRAVLADHAARTSAARRAVGGGLRDLRRRRPGGRGGPLRTARPGGGRCAGPAGVGGLPLGGRGGRGRRRDRRAERAVRRLPGGDTGGGADRRDARGLSLVRTGRAAQPRRGRRVVRGTYRGHHLGRPGRYGSGGAAAAAARPLTGARTAAA